MPQGKRRAHWRYRYWSGRPTLRYKPSDALMLHASAANGTKSGGFNGRATFAGDQAYDPETNRTCEVGAKGALRDRRLTNEIAVYHFDEKNLQMLGPNRDPRQSRYRITSSLDAHMTIGDELTLTGLLEYADQSRQFYEPAGFSHYALALRY